MKKIISCLLIIACSGCTLIKVEKGDAKGFYGSCHPFRETSGGIEYDPETHAFKANVDRKQAVSPELINAAVQAGQAMVETAGK